MQTALITGVSGFVGPYIARELTGRGVSVHGTCWGDADRVPGDLSVQLHEMDLLDAASVADTLCEVAPDLVFHLAAQSSGALSWKLPALTVDVNVKGGVHLLEALRGHPSAKALFIGSSEQYGLTALPKDGRVSEELPMLPTNPYAVSKVAQESLAKLYVKAYGLCVCMTRAFNHIGPGQADTFVISSFAKQIASIEKGLTPPVLKVGDLSAKRDFSDVRDIARAYALLIEAGAPGESYNVGSGEPREIRALLEKLLGMAKVGITVERDPGRMRPVDTPLLVSDNSKLVAATGWRREYAIEDTLLSVLQYWRNTL